MKDLNSCNFTGNVTRDPELKEFTNSKKVSFGIAVNGFKKKDSDDNDVSFFDMEAWGGLADFINNNVKKGDKIAVNCEARLESWEKDGQKRSKVSFKLNDLVKCSWAKDGVKTPTKSKTVKADKPAPSEAPVEDGPIPF